ncbi:hypothetical protein lbkm_2317 [Lachnospiraceae bacterium KM106-2]|nr:hypothetical protein lbkm_2317 [Lachnospiraceae bacterium KM106-2]
MDFAILFLPSNLVLERDIMNLDKLVCQCMRVSNGDIKKAVENGANTLEELQEQTKVCRGCKRCKDNVIRVMEEFQNN